MHSIMLR